MTIRLRPYHPTWIIGFFGNPPPPDGKNTEGFLAVMKKLQADPDTAIEFVEGFDEICERCRECVPDDRGSVWGKAGAWRSGVGEAGRLPGRVGKTFFSREIINPFMPEA